MIRGSATRRVFAGQPTGISVSEQNVAAAFQDPDRAEPLCAAFQVRRRYSIFHDHGLSPATVKRTALRRRSGLLQTETINALDFCDS